MNWTSNWVLSCKSLGMEAQHYPDEVVVGGQSSGNLDELVKGGLHWDEDIRQGIQVMMLSEGLLPHFPYLQALVLSPDGVASSIGGNDLSSSL